MKHSDNLRKANLIRTEYGIVRVAFVIWDTVYVYGKDNRVVIAREVEPIGIGEIDLITIDKEMLREVLQHWLFVHELQNWHFWHTGGQELNIELHESDRKLSQSQIQ